MVVALAVVSALLAISEALDYIPEVKANSISKAIKNILQSVKDFLSKKD